MHRSNDVLSCNDLLDHLVGSGEQYRRNVNAERLRSLEVHDQLELYWLLDRDVGRLRPTEDLVDIICGTPEQIREACCI
jgi:hypothetical protein